MNTRLKDVASFKPDEWQLTSEIEDSIKSPNSKIRKNRVINLLAKYSNLVQETTDAPMSDLELVLAYNVYVGDKVSPYALAKIPDVRQAIVLGFSLMMNYVINSNQPQVVVYPEVHFLKLTEDVALLAPVLEAVHIPIVPNLSPSQDNETLVDIYRMKIVFATEERYLNLLLQDNAIATLTHNFMHPIHLYLIGAYESLIDPANVMISRNYGIRAESEDPFIKRVKEFVDTLVSTDDPKDLSADIFIDQGLSSYKLLESGIEKTNKEFGEQAFDVTSRLGGRFHAGVAAKFLMNKVETARTPIEYEVEGDKIVRINRYMPHLKEALEANEGLPVTYPTFVTNELTMINALSVSLIHVAFEQTETVNDFLQLLGFKQLKPYSFNTLENFYDIRIEFIDFEQSLGQALFMLNKYISDLREEVLTQENPRLSVIYSRLDIVSSEQLQMTDEILINSVTYIMDNIRAYLETYFENVEALRGGILTGIAYQDHYLNLVDDLDKALKDAQLKAFTKVFDKFNINTIESEN